MAEKRARDSYNSYEKAERKRRRVWFHKSLGSPTIELMQGLHTIGAPPAGNLRMGGYLRKPGGTLTQRQRVDAALAMLNALRQIVFEDQRQIDNDYTLTLRDLQIRHIYWLQRVFESVPWRRRVRSTIPLRQSAFAYQLCGTDSDSAEHYRQLCRDRADTFDDELGYWEGRDVSIPLLSLPSSDPPHGWDTRDFNFNQRWSYTRNMNLDAVLEAVLEMLNELRIHVHGSDEPSVRLLPIVPEDIDYIAHVFRRKHVRPQDMNWGRYVYFTMPLTYGNVLVGPFIEKAST